MRGYLPESARNILDARICLSSLQDHLEQFACLFGLQNIYKDGEALKLELTEAQAATKFTHLFWDGVFISPTETLFRTDALAATWQQELSRVMREEPISCAIKLQWRPSVHSGRVWAQLPAAEHQLQAVRAQARLRLQDKVPGEAGRDLESEIRVQGTLGPDPQGLLRAIMDAIASKMQAPLQEQCIQQQLKVGGWQLLRTPGTDELSGRIRVRLTTTAEAKTFERTFQGSPIKVGEETVTLQISNLALATLPNCSSSYGPGGL